MNSCIFTGRITKDPEIKYTQNGAAYLAFTLAVNSTQKDQNGNYIADFIPCKAWQQRADFISKYVKKGNMLSIVGQLKSISYKDQQGNNRVTFEVLVDNVENMTPREPNTQQQAQPQQQPQNAPQYQKTAQQPQQPQPQYTPPQPQYTYNPDVADDDVPF